jgi:hypothetical protein
MTDQELEGAIAVALGQPDNLGKPGLLALRARLQAERAPDDPSLGKLGDALVELAARTPGNLADLLAWSEERARWLAAARGPAHPETIIAWGELAATADLECAWGAAIRAWEAIVASPIDLDHGDPAMHAHVSLALRGLGARCLATGQVDEARRWFARDLALRERMHPRPEPQLAISLGNLAGALERLGERSQALAARRRERDVLVATGASRGQLDSVDRHIAALAAP